MRDKVRRNCYGLWAIMIIILTIGLYFFIQQKGYKLYYTLTPLMEEQAINVTLLIKNAPDQLKLAKGNFKSEKISLTNMEGDPLTWIEEEQAYILKSEKSQNIIFSYNVQVGLAGKHGLRGTITDSFICFEGGQVLVLPFDLTEGKNKVIELDMEYKDFPKTWTPVIPFSTLDSTSRQLKTHIRNPQWMDIYNLIRCCYAFGDLRLIGEEYSPSNIKIYVQENSKIQWEENTVEGILTLNDFYYKLFGTGLEELNIILLDTFGEEKQYVMGGSGYPNIGASFNQHKLRDWQLLSHRMFHSYFDGQVNDEVMHIPPQLWFYEGLATYYENISMESLSKEKLEDLEYTDKDQGLKELYRRYIYSYYKDPGLLRVIPMHEETLSSLGQIEFLHYTQAPLIIALLEERSYNKFGQRDRVLHYILEEKDMDIKAIMTYAVGEEEVIPFAKDYLFGNEPIRLNQYSSQQTDPEKVLNEIRDFEVLMWTWFKDSYQVDDIDDQHMDQLTAIAEKYNIHFSDKLTEDSIKISYPTIYDLLKQHALRANLTGIDMNSSLWRKDLLGNESLMMQWYDFINGLDKSHIDE